MTTKKRATYEKLKPGSKVLSLALMLLMLAAFGYAQSENPNNNQASISSSLPSTLKPIIPTGSGKDILPLNLGSGSFSSYCTYHTYNQQDLVCWDSRIDSNARVFAAASEYSSLPNQRFLGSAHMTVHNIIPHDGYVEVLVDTGWPYYPINVRLDLLVEP
jgi:hypothetical protein